MSYSKAISAGDPQAVEKLTDKMQKCAELQEIMKGVNAHWRSTSTCMGAHGITEAQAAKIDNRIVNARHSWDRQPFSDYELKKIRRDQAAGKTHRGSHAQSGGRLFRLGVRGRPR